MEFCTPIIGKEERHFDVLNLAEYRGEQTKRLHNASVFSIIRTCLPVRIKIGPMLYDFDANELIFIGPQYEVELAEANAADGYLLWFTADFYERSKADTEILHSGLFFGNYPFLSMRECRSDLVFKRLIVERLKECAAAVIGLVDRLVG